MIFPKVSNEDAELLLAEFRSKGLTEIDLIRNLLLQNELSAIWFKQRESGNGKGRVNKIEIQRDRLVVKTWKGEGFELVYQNGYRWREIDGLLESRSNVEARLGVWPGYLDALEDVFREAQRLGSDYERIQQSLEEQYAIERHPELRRWRSENPTPPNQVPDVLRHIRHIKRLQISEPSYIYFLLKESKVVYVGQTCAPWPGRILQHLRANAKTFDDVWYLESDRVSLDAIEKRFIDEFKPIYNGDRRFKDADS